MMSKFTADQIIARIANANDIEPAVLRRQIEQSLPNIVADPTFTPETPLPSGNPTVDELIVSLEYELYDAMMPRFPGWEWDGGGYRNIQLFGKKQ